MEEQQPHILRDIWLSELHGSGSGKTTLALILKQRFTASRVTHTYLLDGDDLRYGINSDMEFSLAGHYKNLCRATHTTRLFSYEGYWLLASFNTPMNSQQVKGRQLGPTRMRPRDMSTVIPFSPSATSELTRHPRKNHFRDII